MPGGRPRKYADKDAAKAAGRLRAAERKAERKAAGESHDGVRIKAEGGYRFILEDMVCFKLRLQWYSSSYSMAIVSNTNIYRQSQWTTARRPAHPSLSRSPSPVKGPPPSLPPPSPSTTDVNGSDIPSLDAFGKLSLESTIGPACQRACPDADRAESPSSIKNADPPDNDRDEDYSAKLSDVFIDFAGDFGHEFHSTAGEVDDPDATIILENAVCHTSATAPNSTDNIRNRLRPHRNLY
jgi:hypothetical protein